MASIFGALAYGRYEGARGEAEEHNYRRARTLWRFQRWTSGEFGQPDLNVLPAEMRSTTNEL